MSFFLLTSSDIYICDIYCKDEFHDVDIFLCVCITVYIYICVFHRMQRKKGQFTSSKAVSDEVGSASSDWNGNSGQDEQETSWVSSHFVITLVFFNSEFGIPLSNPFFYYSPYKYVIGYLLMLQWLFTSF